MGRFKIAFLLAALLCVVAVIPRMEAQGWGHPPPLLPPRPLCSSQFALASYACARLPVNPDPIPIPPPPSPDVEEGNGHGHGHGHRHHHGRHHHSQSPVAEECCRWARQVDSECVCEALVHLANFLVRPSHAFTVAITDECIVTYSCNGRITIWEHAPQPQPLFLSNNNP